MSGFFLQYFTDPILRSSTIGCMFMCLATSLVGVLVYLQKRSLIGETLSHCVYPGLIIGALMYKMIFSSYDILIPVMIGGAISAGLGLLSINFFERKLKMSSDVALCLTLASFFGMGFLLVSRIQFVFPQIYQKIQMYLYGQAATMRNKHVLIYFILATVIIIFIILLFRHIEMVYFDRTYAKSSGLPIKTIESLIFFLLILAIVIGMRTVGIILMSGMLIAPAISARQFTDKLSLLFIFSAFFALSSAFLGNVFSHVLSYVFSSNSLSHQHSFPIGPIIVIIASLFAIFSLLFAPKRGVVFRYIRVLFFKRRVSEENVLKIIYKQSSQGRIDVSSLKQMIHLPRFFFSFFLFHLQRQGWIEKKDANQLFLTKDGKNKALRIMRLHRLWEAYLQYWGLQGENVHLNAEEMEHVMTKEIEEKLEEILSHPKIDPHHKPIPQKTKYLYDNYRI